MASPSNHWKLGLFVVTSVVLGLGTLVVLGARGMHKEMVGYTTYFDESVQGLDVGSPVKFRGVVVGYVSHIDIARDRRHVEVGADLIIENITRLGLAVGKGDDTQIRVPAELRMQLASAGITGVKFVQIDFFPIADNPRPVLPFPVPENYIPAAVSVMKNIEDSIVHAVNRIPEAVDQALVIMRQVGALLKDLEGKAVPDHVLSTLAQVNHVLGGFEATVGQLQTGHLSKQTLLTLENINSVVTQMNGLITRVAAVDGFYASAQRSSDAVGDVARNAAGIGVEVEGTLRSVKEAAQSIQRFTDALERDSDMLLKGRTKRER